MSVKRYEIHIGEHEGSENESPNGEWVRFVDYARAAKERDSALFLAKQRLTVIRELEQIP